MKHWFSRLLPVGGVAVGLTAVAWGLSFGPIAEDVAGRTAERLKSEGRSWAKITMDGRDLTLTGTAPDPATRQLAAESADRVFGVRIVDDRATVLPLADPYRFGASRDGDKITLSGSIPSEEVRAALLAAVKAAAPGAAIDDRLTLARGAPATYAAATAFAAGQLGGLIKGNIGIGPDGYRIDGNPKDQPTYDALEAALKSALPAGVPLASDGLIAPIPMIDPYRFTATRSGDRIVLTGHVPTEEARAALLAAAKAAAPGVSVVDELKLGRGAPSIFAAAAAFAVGQLAGVTDGSAGFAPAGYTIAGQPKDFASYKAMKSALSSAMPQGLALAADQLVVPTPSPYRFGLATAGGVATLDGFLPSADARAKVLALLAGLYGKVDDKTEIAPGAPVGFLDAILGALPGLKRLSDGGFDLSGTKLTVKGGVLTEAIGRQILDRLRGLLPGGFVLADVAPTLLPPPPQVDPATCQATLAAAQSGEKILFEVGKAALDARSVGVLDKLVGGALACRSARIFVEGHTDTDGDPEANMALSEARAAAVVDYLVAAGIAADRLTAAGFGETAPIASNDTAEGKQQNRRIDFRVE